jgi:hypothetical protein
MKVKCCKCGSEREIDDELIDPIDITKPFTCLSCYGIAQLTSAGNESYDVSSKPTNPKDTIGSDKVPIHLWPETATILGAMALLDGALKYGRANWRHDGARASIYFDACRRHLNKWFEGEDTDPDSGLPHLAHALASIAIVVDAEAMGELVDDRQFATSSDGRRYAAAIDALTPHVKRLKDLYKDRKPKHWTIADV